MCERHVPDETLQRTGFLRKELEGKLLISERPSDILPFLTPFQIIYIL